MRRRFRIDDEVDEDDEDGEEAESAAKNDEPEYQFAGYDVVFSEKIALTPPAQQKGPAK